MTQTFAEVCGAKFCVFLCFLCAINSATFCDVCVQSFSHKIHRNYKIPHGGAYAKFAKTDVPWPFSSHLSPLTYSLSSYNFLRSSITEDVLGTQFDDLAHLL